MIKKRYISPATHIVQMYELETSILNVSDTKWMIETRGIQVNDYVEGEDFDSVWGNE